MKKFSCKEYGCPNEGYYITVYGCLDAHIRELLFCYEHGRAWIEIQREGYVRCSQCGDLVDSYICDYASKLKAAK